MNLNPAAARLSSGIAVAISSAQAATASALTRRNISVSEVAPAPGALPWPPHTQGGSAELGKLARQEVAVPRRSTLLGLGLI
jgi:hypothetical protein